MTAGDEFAYSVIYQPCSGSITGDIIIPAGTYQVSCTIDVPTGITLTIEPSSILKFSGGAITVDGTLDAVGTASNPIVFTSLNDNSIGGTTGSGAPAAGDWTGIAVNGTGSIDIEYATVDYAVNAIGASTASASAVTCSHDTIADPSGVGIAVTGASSPLITDNVISEPGQSGLALSSVSDPVISGNSVTAAGSFAYLLGSGTLGLSGVSNNDATGATAEFVIYGTLSESSTLNDEAIPWVLDGLAYGQLTIAGGVTLTVSPGTIVKLSNGVGAVPYGPQNYLCPNSSLDGNLCVDGTLDAVGTASNPIVFTSLNDNSIGGGTGTGSPAAGDWTGIAVNGTGSIDIEYATVDYAVNAIGASTASASAVTCSHDTIADPSGVGIAVTGASSPLITDNVISEPGQSGLALSSVSDPVISGNSVTAAGSFAYLLGSGTLGLSGVSNNDATGATAEFVIYGTLSESSTLNDEAIPWVLDGLAYGQLTIAGGVTLTVSPGTIVKLSNGVGAVPYGPQNYLCPNSSLDGNLCVDGTLDAVGTASNPIVFTSLNDNSIGGTTGSGAPAAGDWTGIAVNGTGSIDIEYATVDYAVNAIGASTASASAVTCSHDTIADPSGVGIAVTGASSPLITDNVISEPGQSGLALSSVSDPVISGNSVTAAGSFAYLLGSGTLGLSGVSNNDATGATAEFVIYGTLSESSTLNDEAIPWVLDGLAYGQLTIAGGVTLTVSPGTIVKLSNGVGAVPYGPQNYLCPNSSLDGNLCVDGTLDAVGTASNPIVFTSLNDNSIGGGTGTGSPAAGDWTGIGVDSGGSIDLEHAKLSYAWTGVSINTPGMADVVAGSITDSTLAVSVSAGAVQLRASLSNDTEGVTACSWGTSGCSVDAAYTYWGSSSGPNSGGSSASSCGQVILSPYFTDSSETSTASVNQFESDCGSTSSPVDEYSAAQTAYDQRLSTEQALCNGNPPLQDACQAYQQMQACTAAALSLAESNSGVSFSYITAVSTLGDQLAQAASQVVSTIGKVLSYSLQIVGVFGIFSSLVNAYQTC